MTPQSTPEKPPLENKRRPGIGKIVIASFSLGYGLYLCWGLVRISQVATAIEQGALSPLAFRAFLNDILFKVLFTGFCLSLFFIPVMYLIAFVYRRTIGR